MLRHIAVSRWLSKCDSSHERVFSLALLVEPEFSFEPDGDRFVDARGVVLAQKHRIGRYVLDFAFPSVRVIVEVDGHPMHDLSAERVESDRQRDRRLLAEGWRTLRFSGREVTEDALRCAREAYTMATSAVTFNPTTLQIPLMFVDAQ